MSGMIGERIRGARQSQGRSLADVAGKAKISVATLSRIENDKQSVDLDLFLMLAKVLRVNTNELLETNESEDRGDPLARRIAGLNVVERTVLWRDIATERRNHRKRRSASDLGEQVDELLAQIEFLREELEAVRLRVRRK